MSAQTSEQRQAVAEILRAEIKQRGPRQSVRDPLTLTINGVEFTITPCSGAHRAYWLTGYIVASCGRCKHEREAVQ